VHHRRPPPLARGGSDTAATVDLASSHRLVRRHSCGTAPDFHRCSPVWTSRTNFCAPARTRRRLAHPVKVHHRSIGCAHCEGWLGHCQALRRFGRHADRSSDEHRCGPGGRVRDLSRQRASPMCGDIERIDPVHQPSRVEEPPPVGTDGRGSDRARDAGDHKTDRIELNSLLARLESIVPDGAVTRPIR
jgi:hypothetical protein